MVGLNKLILTHGCTRENSILLVTNSDLCIYPGFVCLDARRNHLKFPPPDTSYSRGRKRGRRKRRGGEEMIVVSWVRNASYPEAGKKGKRWGGGVKVSCVAG